MNLIKSSGYFNPLEVKHRCHIIGCGAVGSTIAEGLARLGIKDISLYDFDFVESHNITNQLFIQADMKSEKVDATKRIITDINPEAESGIKIFPEGYTDETRLSGFIFLCVDNIELRRSILCKHKDNKSIIAVFDFRTGLEIAQHFAADWNNYHMVENIIKSTDFSHEEAVAAAPTTACGITLGVASTVRIICHYGIANFVNYIRKGVIKKTIFVDIFNFDLEAY